VVQPVTSPGLLERVRELDLLRLVWRQACAGRGSAWLVCAEAGGGKTRLLREATRGGPVRWGTAQPVTPPDPYLAVMQALRGFRPASQRADSIARAIECLERLAGDGPIAVVLDDLHFADEGTVAVFVRLAMLSETRPWLILGALRPGEGSAVLWPAVTELVAHEHAQRLDLQPLSRAAVATLVADVRDRPVGEEEADALFADSGGNPWYAMTLARGAGAMSAARDRILLRVDRLEQATPGARSLLAGLAPAGAPLPHAVVASVGGGDGPELRRMLRGLRNAAVLREHDGTWQFQHELLRRSLLEEMLDADRRDAHRRLAEVLESRVPSPESPGRGLQLGTVTAAAVAMHYADAGDARAGVWALRAAREARAVDAHVESLAQLERALAFPLEPEARRTALRAAAQGAWYVGRFCECLRFAEEGLTIPGGEPEVISRLHQHAADCARVLGRTRTAADHIDAAEWVLEGQPVSVQMLRLATARVWESAVRLHPERVVPAADRAVRLARAFDDRSTGAWYELVTRCYLGLSLLDAGDPAGFAPFESMLELGAARPEITREIVPQALNAYSAAVRSLFHAEAQRYREWLFEAIERHHLEWEGRAGPYQALEMVQRGAFADARARLKAMVVPPPRTIDHAVWLCARALYEARAGSLTRAQAVLAPSESPGAFAYVALVDLARLDGEWSADKDGTATPPAKVYARAEGRRFARLAGMAAVALAWAGREAPARPSWLVAASPLGVFWDWAGGIAARDAPALRAVATRFEEMSCPYEAALARRDAGDLQEAYRALRTLGATRAREAVAKLLRAAGQPIPRGSRAGADSPNLTDTERAICRLVVEGATNAAIAAALSMGVRTVEAHLSHIYQKTGRQGRVALAGWWRERGPGES